MDIETLFSAANGTAFLAWVLLGVGPRWRWTARVVVPVVVPALFALAYGALVLRGLPGSDGGFGSLAAVARLFEDREMLFAGWLHYLAFDLFVGSWEVRDAQRLGIPHVFVLPCLVLTFLLGPVGLLLYLAIRAPKRGLAIEGGER